ncbi:MAG: S1 RNA-binding domain-containing protein [Chloroflexi bacterium]|nr:S1 RNA-binding domain-containing protein [Chloroflexota bacterium]
MDMNGFTDENLTDDNNLTDPSPPSQDMGDYLEDYQAPKRGDICTGVVIGIEDRGWIVDVGLKREGLVPAGDLDRMDEETRPAVYVGAEVSVFVLRPEDRDGRPILSIHQAQLSKDWVEAEEMMASGDLYEGEISGHNRGGLIVNFGKIQGFIPASQIIDLPKRLSQEDRRQRLADMIGQEIGLRIIEVDRRRRRLIFSQRRALRAWQERQRNRVMDELTEGEVRHGKVTSITNFGAFVDLGGADGLIHVSELGWGRVDNPRQVLKVGEEVAVYVLSVDRQRKRIALSLKRLQPDPWTLIDDHYQANQLVEGRITRVLDFGAFVELDLGVEGLLHASEMLGTPELAPTDIVHAGEKLLVKIIRIDSGKRRLAPSAKQVRQNEWERWVAEQQATSETLEGAAEEAEPEVEEVVVEPVEEAAVELEAEEAVAEPVEEAAVELEAEEVVVEPVEEAAELG